MVWRLILLLLTVSCGPAQRPKSGLQIAAPLSPYVAEYRQDMARYHLPGIIRLDIVLCTDYLKPDPTSPHDIILGRTYWVWDFSDLTFHSQVFVVCDGGSLRERATTFHELTHALYGLGHSVVPNSIQNAYIPTEEVLEDTSWDNLVNDLFHFIQRGGRDE